MCSQIMLNESPRAHSVTSWDWWPCLLLNAPWRGCLVSALNRTKKSGRADCLETGSIIPVTVPQTISGLAQSLLWLHTYDCLIKLVATAGTRCDCKFPSCYPGPFKYRSPPRTSWDIWYHEEMKELTQTYRSGQQSGKNLNTTENYPNKISK